MSGYRLSIGRRASLDPQGNSWLKPISQEGRKPSVVYTDFDQIMEEIGSEGRYQKFLLYGFLGPVSLMVPFFMFNIIFMLHEPDHWCHVDGRDNGTDLEAWKNMTLPVETELDGTTRFSHCLMFNGSTSDVVPCQDGWDFDRKDYAETLTSHFNWVCDKGQYATDALTFASLGNALGSILLSPVADKMGRKPIFFFLCLANILFRVCSLLSAQEFIAFLLLQLLHGMAFPLMYIVSTMLVCEISSSDYRAWIYTFTWIMWVVGFAALPLLAWLTRTWYLMGMVTSLPGVFLLIFWKYVPESPAWLVSQGRIVQATNILEKIADVNGTSEKIKGKNIESILEGLKKTSVEDGSTVLTLFSRLRIARNTIMISIMWATNNVVNFGITLVTHQIPGNQFLNFFILAITEVPAAYLGGVMADCIGRRYTQIIFYFITTISCAGAAAGYWIYAGNIYVVLAFVILAKFAITVTFLVVYIQVTEIFPTQLRSTGSGFASTVGSAMTIAAPYTAYFGKTHAALPYLFLTAIALAGTLASSLIPETLNQKLPETTEDADNLGKRQKIWLAKESIADVPTEETANGVKLESVTHL